MLLAGANIDLVCNALLVTNRALRKWINRFNHCGVDGLIVKKRPGPMTNIKDQQALQLTNLIDQPQQAQRAFWTAKAFHGYSSKEYQVQCSYETVVRSFLDEANKTVLFQRTTNILIVDNATWHRRKDTNWHRWKPKYTKSYSPDLNPIERIWLTMKACWFNNYVCKNEKQLLERLDQAIFDVINNPKKTQKTACIATLL